MPSYEHFCESCEYEFEEEYSIKADPPKVCPKCGKETVKRLISGGSGRGIVELSGQDLKDKLKADGAKLRHETYSSEKKYANFIGEQRYQQLQKGMDKK